MPNVKTLPAGTVRTTWEVWTYDVWGNAHDGWEVNDRFCVDRALELTLKAEKFNAGTAQEFRSASPSDKQIKQVFGVRCKIEVDGDDVQVYVTRARDGYPIGEMTCTSHESLSPVKPVTIDLQSSAWDIVEANLTPDQM